MSLQVGMGPSMRAVLSIVGAPVNDRSVCVILSCFPLGFSSLTIGQRLGLPRGQLPEAEGVPFLQASIENACEVGKNRFSCVTSF